MSDHQNRSGALLQNPDKISSYFKNQWPVLLIVTITGLVYNIGQAIGPWFEGQLTQCLADIISGTDTFSSMVKLAFGYLILIGIVQGTRFLKRLYVRKFSNNINRSMKQVLYANLIRQSKTELETAGTGNVMTKAISDVDACAEGMRKFTTEIFDTGIALLAYGILLFSYDWRLAILSLLFVPLCYFIAEKMKTVVQRTGAANKESAGRLNAATLDRISGTVTYRVYGCELQRDQDYEEKLSDYEKSAVRAGIPTAAMPPIYTVISTAGVVFIFIFGSRNVLGTGWTVWNIAAFTAFLSCFTKVATKASRAAKLFNAVHKAQVSWKRIKSLMHTPKLLSDVPKAEAKEIRAVDLSISYKGYQGGEKVLHDIEFTVAPGSIIGITGAVACGKSTLGRAFLCETPYKGSITYGGKEFSELSEDERCGIVGYLGHKPELLSDTIARNILMGDSGDVHEYLRAVCMDEEVNSMTEDINTRVGDGGVRLSGGQQQRIALARTLAHLRPLLVLDDPFSALDRATELEIFENLKKMAKGSTIFLISHRLYLFPEMDGVIWMENGTGMLSNHEILMETVPQYAALYKAQESEEKTEGVQSNENKSSLG